MNNRVVYCHFSFKRPKGQSEYGYFAVAFYNDFEGKDLCAQATRQLRLWEDQQFVTAIQAYEHALYSIYEWQGLMKSKGISQVMLVTDNTTLANWIENPNKNKKYTKYMNRAIEKYRSGGSKEIILGIGLCEPWDYERSYKFCKADKVINTYKPKKKESADVKKKLGIDREYMKTALDIIKDDTAIPEIEGMEPLSGEMTED